MHACIIFGCSSSSVHSRKIEHQEAGSSAPPPTKNATQNTTVPITDQFVYCTSGKRTAMSPDCVMYLTHGNDGYCS